jgi:hypothetical protein
MFDKRLDGDLRERIGRRPHPLLHALCDLRSHGAPKAACGILARCRAQ